MNYICYYIYNSSYFNSYLYCITDILFIIPCQLDGHMLVYLEDFNLIWHKYS